jgi:endoribonuclease Dicer
LYIFGIQKLETVPHVDFPIQVLKAYPCPPQTYEDFLEPTLYSCLHIFEKYLGTIMPWTSIERRYEVTYANLGPFAASYFLYFEMIYQLKHSDRHPQGPDDGSDSSGSSLFLEVQAILEEFTSFFSHFAELDAKDSLPLIVPSSWYTPKVSTLVDILLEHLDLASSFRGIIFVDQRQVAVSLSIVLSSISKLQGRIRSCSLVGENSDRVIGDIGRTHSRNVIKMFRDGELDLRTFGLSSLCTTS